MTSTTRTNPRTDPALTKTAILVDALSRPEGATIDDLAKATGWQTHSVRGALAGALKKKGYRITSGAEDGVRRYRIEVPE